MVASECAKKTPSYAENEIGEKNNEEGIDLNKQFNCIQLPRSHRTVAMLRTENVLDTSVEGYKPSS